MHIVAVIVFLGLMYFWLAGHWFGRCLAFVAFGLAFSVIGAAIEKYPLGIVIVIGGWIAAWFISRVPMVYWGARA